MTIERLKDFFTDTTSPRNATIWCAFTLVFGVACFAIACAACIMGD